jgi:mannosyltransferase OCH1-like enzyme
MMGISDHAKYLEPKLLIPRIFHWIWLGPNSMPSEYERYQDEWLAMHPGWKMMLWDMNDFDHMQSDFQLVNQEQFDGIGNGQLPWPHSMAGHPPEIALAVQRADIMCYELIHKFGGVYLNCDIKPIKNIEPLLAGRSAFCAKEDDVHLVNMAMGCMPMHPFYGAVIDRLPSRMKELHGQTFERQTGAHLLTEVYHWLGDEWDLDIHEPEIWNPVHFNQVPSGGSGIDNFVASNAPNSYAVHGWGHRRVV